MKQIVAFDFDGTLTRSDSFLELITFAHGKWAFAWALLVHAPLIVLMKLRLYSNQRAKEHMFRWFFGGMDIGDFDALCRRFAKEKQGILRPEGIKAMAQAREQGAEVLVVSASIDNWVRPFFPQATIVGTQIEVVNSTVTGRFATKNCYGKEKVNRIATLFPHRENYRLTAYGDSRGDRELLQWADEAHYKPFR